MSSKITLLLIIAALGAGYYFYDDLRMWYQLANTQIESGVERLKQVERKVVTPSPLRGPIEQQQSHLTVAGTVEQTNARRQANGLSKLSINAKLAQAAQRKVDDMFARQYFEHESPTGEGPGDLADDAGYKYIVVGENLALGNYRDDDALVTAWMNSPPHRENILTAEYSEIGVAVKRGTFNGREVWLAVQEFGRPESECPRPDTSLKAQIDENRAELDTLEQELRTLEKELENMRPKRGPAYNRKVEEYNALVDEYNALVNETKELTRQYNAQVDARNACL